MKAKMLANLVGLVIAVLLLISFGAGASRLLMAT
jgi:hypothetical protein